MVTSGRRGTGPFTRCSSLADAYVLRLRLADLARVRAEYVARQKRYFVAYLDRLIAEVEAEIALAEQAKPAAPKPS